MADVISSLADRLNAGETVITGWSMLPEPLSAETLARAGYDAVTLDMQHGLHTIDTVLRGIGAVGLAGKPAIVRIPVGDFASASRALDMGAAAVIAPMVNSYEDAQKFTEFMKFPPTGARSWGPHRALAVAGDGDLAGYLAHGNDRTLSFAMIETREAVTALESILGVAGIDGVFVGPSDLSIGLSDGANLDPTGEQTMSVAEEIAERANQAGKIAGIFCSNVAHVGEAMDLGYRLIAIGVDGSILRAGAEALLANIGR